MKTAELRAFGMDGLVWTDRDVPKPSAGEVLVRMKAWSLNFRDLMVVRGQYNPKLRMPITPLSDGCGEVVEVGEGVTRVRTGDRVAAAFMQGWVEGYIDDAKWKTALGAGVPGVAAEYCVFHESGVVRIPDYLSPEEAAALPCAAVTAWNALFESGALKPGDTVLTLGTGGVSIFALQFAGAAGARVLVTSSSNSKLERALELGAYDGVNYSENPDWDKAIRRLTEDRGVDQVIEVGGAGTLPRSMKAVRTGGTISLIGVLAKGGDVNPAPILMRHLRVQGIFVGSTAMFENMLGAMTVRQLRPVIDRVFGFDELRPALEHMESAAHIGKICLRAR